MADSHIQTIIFGSLAKADRPFIYVFWNLFISRLKTQSCVNRKISSFLLESSSNNGNWANWPLLGPLRLI